MASYICPIFRTATQTFLLPCGKDQFTVLILKFGIEAQKIVLISVHCQEGEGVYIQATQGSRLAIGCVSLLGRLINYDDDNIKLNLMIKTTALHVHHAFSTFLQTFTARLRRETS